MKIKDRIIESSRELFFRHGIRSVTMDDVARHMGISKKTLYSSFKEKDKIVTKIMESYILDRQSHFAMLSDQSKDPIYEIMLIMKEMGNMFRTINPSLFYDLQKYFPDAWKKFQIFKKDCMLEVVEANLKKGIELGLYRSEISVKIIARLRIEEVELAFKSDAFPPSEFNLSQIQICLLDHYLHGIATIPGLKLIDKYKKSLPYSN